MPSGYAGSFSSTASAIPRTWRLPVVLTQDEVRQLLSHVDGMPKLILKLLYGSGLRLAEGLRLRIKDLDFARLEITVREDKGAKDRRTMLPSTLVDPLKRQVAVAERLHRQGSARRLWACLPPTRAGTQVPERRDRMGVAVRLPFLQAVARSPERRDSAASPVPADRSPSHETSAPSRQDPEARHGSHPTPQFRDPSFGRRLRHPDGSGASRTLVQCPHDHDLHPRPQPRRARRPESRGRAIERREPAIRALFSVWLLAISAPVPPKAVRKPSTASRTNRVIGWPRRSLTWWRARI